MKAACNEYAEQAEFNLRTETVTRLRVANL